jgi:MFS family permease
MAEPAPGQKPRGFTPIKWVFALEYMMQGLANPFQGITYQPFFSHFRHHYGLTEAATQAAFAQSYLAWSFKPVLGFLIDAYGRTRTIMVVLLSLGALGYLLTPLIDVGPQAFFWSMFLLSVCFAGTDVAVDRATVVEGAQEAEHKGVSKATTVGINQAICWLSIYGTSIVAAVLGGYLTEVVPFGVLMASLAVVPMLVLIAVWRLPKDKVTPIPLSRSFGEFWRGIHTGPILAVMLFYFVFTFQPAMGPLWNNYLLEQLKFTPSQVGISEGVGYTGYVLGVVLFTTKGLKWQERFGLRRLFRFYIGVSVLINLTQYLQVEPWFSTNAALMGHVLPFASLEQARLVYLCVYSGLQATALSMITMSTFSLVGSVVPTTAAGSLFAGFMSVSNLALSFSYASGAWLYEHGLEYSLLRGLQSGLFGVAGDAGANMSVNMLILVGSATFLLSFACVHVLPDRAATLASHGSEEVQAGPERWLALPAPWRKSVDVLALGVAVCWFGVTFGLLDVDVIAAVLVTFFGTIMVRKATLDVLLKVATR